MDIAGKVENVVMAAVDRLNLQLPPDQQVDKASATPLAGSSNLESLSLVILISEVENGIEEAFDMELALTEEEELLNADGPLRTLGSLTSFVGNKVREQLDG